MAWLCRQIYTFNISFTLDEVPGRCVQVIVEFVTLSVGRKIMSFGFIGSPDGTPAAASRLAEYCGYSISIRKSKIWMRTVEGAVSKKGGSSSLVPPLYVVCSRPYSIIKSLGFFLLQISRYKFATLLHPSST